MKYFAVEVPDDKAEVVLIQQDKYPWLRVKEVVLDDIDGDTFETVTVLT